MIFLIVYRVNMKYLIIKTPSGLHICRNANFYSSAMQEPHTPNEKLITELAIMADAIISETDLIQEKIDETPNDR